MNVYIYIHFTQCNYRSLNWLKH